MQSVSDKKDNKFIFVIPMYSKQEINADSNYVVSCSLVNALLNRFPQWYFFFLMPGNPRNIENGYKYKDDGFFAHPRIEPVIHRLSPRKLSNAVSFDGIFLDEFLRKHAIDAIWTSLPEWAAIKYAGDATFKIWDRPLVVAAHNYVIHDSLDYPMHSLLPVLWRQISGSYLADYNVFNSDYCHEMFIDSASKFLNQDAINHIISTSRRIDMAMLEPEIGIPDKAPATPPVIAYNHRLQKYKNFSTTFNVLGELWEEGERFKVKYMNNTAEKTSKIRKYEFVEIKLCATRKEYLHELSECDLNVTNSNYETFCCGGVESMAMGQCLVAPDDLTFPYITGKDELGYPYLFPRRDLNAQKQILRTLFHNIKEREAWGKKLSEYVREKFSNKIWAKEYGDLILEGCRIREENIPDRSQWVIDKALHECPNVSLQEFKRKVYSIRDSKGKQPFSNQSLILSAMATMIRRGGGRVVWKKINSTGQQWVLAR